MKNKTNLSLIFSCLSALIAIAGFVFGSYYINGLTAKSSTLQEEIVNKESKIKRIQNINKSAERTAEDRVKISNYFVGANGAIDFVSSLESTAASLGLTYTTNAIDTKENEILVTQGKELFRTNMTLSGSWRNVIKYLLYIESLPFSIDIEKVELVSEGVSVAAVNPDASSTAATRSLSESKWRMNIAFSVIKFKEKK